MPSFVLDTSAFINGWNHHYRLPVFAGVWDALARAMQAGDVVSPSEVLVELSKRAGDPLHQWAISQRPAFWLPSPSWNVHMGSIQEYAPHWFTGAARHDADPFVVAMAMAEGLPVVTYEGLAFSGQPTQVRTTKRGMPHVCAQLGVPVAGMFDVLNHLGAVFT